MTFQDTWFNSAFEKMKKRNKQKLQVYEVALYQNQVASINFMFLLHYVEDMNCKFSKPLSIVIA